MLATIPPPPGNVLELGPLTIHYYGAVIAVGAILAIMLTRRRYASFGGDPDLIDRVGVLAVFAGFLGARLAWASVRLDQFADRPWAILFVWEGGLAFFGGLTFGILAAYWFARRHQMRVPALADAVAPALPLAQAIGRWGNYFNQELYGTPTTVPWALEVEAHRRVAPFQEFATFHPTFLYESLLNLVLCGVLIWVGRTGRLRAGSLLFGYLAGYGAIRFCVELLRTDTDFRILGLSRNNWVALGVCLLGLGLMAWWQQRGGDDERADDDPVEAAEAE